MHIVKEDTVLNSESVNKHAMRNIGIPFRMNISTSLLKSLQRSSYLWRGNGPTCKGFGKSRSIKLASKWTGKF